LEIIYLFRQTVQVRLALFDEALLR
jgi:hypothetical protein